MEKKYFVGSVGKPGDGYDDENFNKCIQHLAHIMHKDTPQKGDYHIISTNDIIFLKYKFNLVAFGVVLSVDKSEKDDSDGWDYYVNVQKWNFYNEEDHSKGTSKYGIGDATITGSKYATIKQINLDFATKLLSNFKVDIMNKSNKVDYIKLLETNKNIILTGAPGTGKSYLAREIAKEFIAAYNNGQTEDKPQTISSNDILNTIKVPQTITSSKDRTSYVINAIIDNFVCINGNTIKDKRIPFSEIIRAYEIKMWDGLQHNGFDSYSSAIAKFIYENINVKLENTEQIGFVQFHPSYDYTDFVEGLRAKEAEGSGVTFALHNGIFKEFCKRAITKDSESIDTGSFDDLYNEFVSQISEDELILKTPIHSKKFKVLINSKNSCCAVPDTEAATEMVITKQMLKNYILNGTIGVPYWKPYTTAIGEYFKTKYGFKLQVSNSKSIDKKYIFIIDEINRGEISKIFGELFFSIDPGYRGIEGKIKTQYANLHSYETETVFDPQLGVGWFYVPENVYIIGTMNDIDRSVESMDFAMRRRFTWIEVDAKSRTEMLGQHLNHELAVEAKKRMLSINKEIEKIPGLSKSYHIGPAYFLNLQYYKDDRWEKLWDYHIEPLVKEYLRGMPDAHIELEKIERTFFNCPQDDSE